MAEVKSSVDKNRTILREAVPLDSPLSMYIEPTRVCNFKCFYCMHSTRGVTGGALDRTGFELKHMDMELFAGLVKDIMSFPTVPKRVCFSGLGEPLTNKNLPDMIRMLRSAGFTGRIDVISNGSLLTHEMSDALLDAGISRIQISLQGLTSEKYQEICQTRVDMDTLKDNIRYFYERRGNATIYVKIIDSILENKEQEEQFYQMFGGICDTIYVEHLVIMEQQMGNHGRNVDTTRNLMGEVVEKRMVCGVMFYFLQVNIDGETFPCSTPGLPNSFSMGCAKEKSLLDIWNDSRRNALIRKNLKDGYASIPACATCSSCIAIADDSEYLDDCREEILDRFPERQETE
jgi:wyosine [tRNA(Phe)-imidazoG37] synthetase (radical SAM superfamily)